MRWPGRKVDHGNTQTCECMLYSAHCEEGGLYLKSLTKEKTFDQVIVTTSSYRHHGSLPYGYGCPVIKCYMVRYPLTIQYMVRIVSGSAFMEINWFKRATAHETSFFGKNISSPYVTL